MFEKFALHFLANRFKKCSHTYDFIKMVSISLEPTLSKILNTYQSSFRLGEFKVKMREWSQVVRSFHHQKYWINPRKLLM